MRRLAIILFVLILLPFVLGATTFFDSDDSFIMADISIPSPVVPPTGGGGGGGITVLECVNDSGCDLGEFCFENKCYIYECDSDADCNDTKTCWMNRCVKLFDMKIIEVQSPIYSGEFFNFTYYLKGVAAIHGDVVVKFWLVRDGEVVTEGFDTIYVGDFEEKTESSELFLPTTILPGTYNFYAELEYDSYYARAGRIIGVEEVPKEIIEERRGITGEVIGQIGEGIKTNVLSILITAGIFILGIIIYWERKKIKRALVREKKWIKRNKVSISTGFFFIILIGIIYYLNKQEIISLPSLKNSFINLFNGICFLIKNYYFYFIGLIILILIIIFYKKIVKILKFKKRVSRIFKNIKIRMHERKLLIKKKKKERLLRKKGEHKRESILLKKHKIQLLKNKKTKKREEKKKSLDKEKKKLELNKFFLNFFKKIKRKRHKIKLLREQRHRKKILEKKKNKLALFIKKGFREAKHNKKLMKIKKTKVKINGEKLKTFRGKIIYLKIKNTEKLRVIKEKVGSFFRNITLNIKKEKEIKNQHYWNKNEMKNYWENYSNKDDL